MMLKQKILVIIFSVMCTYFIYDVYVIFFYYKLRPETTTERLRNKVITTMTEWLRNTMTTTMTEGLGNTMTTGKTTTLTEMTTMAESTSNIAQFAELMEERQRSIAKTCGQRKKSRAMDTRFLISWFHRQEVEVGNHWLLWCPVFKAGSTNWYLRLFFYFK